jgi:preprotein translocase subunit SecF
MFVVTYRKIFYAISVILIGFSVFAVAFWGLNFGIDFKGGSILEVEFAAPGSATIVNDETVHEVLAKNNQEDALVRTTEVDGKSGYIIRTKALTEPERQEISGAFQALGGEVTRFDSVGPILGQELQKKAISSIIYVLIAILLFITYAFRHVSLPVSSWKYGLVALVALAHDVIVPTGLFAYLGRNGGYEIDALFITALLVILGFSIHDTIVVFDRTRENLKNGELKKRSFEHVVGMSVQETFSRSINTSLTTIIALIVLWFLGPMTVKNFSLALIIGIITGTYSSIFIGSPLLVTLEKWQEKKANKAKK